MKLSKLLEQDDVPSHVYGVEVDTYVNNFPANLKEVGVLLKKDDDDVDFAVLDIVISLNSKGKKVLCEQPFDVVLNPASLVPTMHSLGADISILMPESLTKGNIEAYISRLEEYARFWMSDSAYSVNILPISGFYQYMINNVFGHQPKQITEDPYIQKSFVDGVSMKEMDYIKDRLKAVIFDIFGGEEEFSIHAHSIGASTIKSEVLQAG